MENNNNNLEAMAELAKRMLLPERSVDKYEKAYEKFVQWLDENNGSGNFSETNVLAYFHTIKDTYAPTSLWSIYSMIRSTLLVKHDVNIKDYCQVKSFIKRLNEDYEPDQAPVFSDEEISKFLTEAPDYLYLADKVICVLGLFGCCRADEIVKIAASDVEKHGSIFLVKIRKLNTKTKTQRTFTITDEYFTIVSNYIDLKPGNARQDRFLLNFQKGRIHNQPIGKKKIQAAPKRIAAFLKLKDAEEYTGHSFRRTSATLLANGGATMDEIMRFGSWKSSNSAKRYVEDSVINKQKTANILANELRSKYPTKNEPASTNGAGVSKYTNRPQVSKSPSYVEVPTYQTDEPHEAVYSRQGNSSKHTNHFYLQNPHNEAIQQQQQQVTNFTKRPINDKKMKRPTMIPDFDFAQDLMDDFDFEVQTEEIIKLTQEAEEAQHVSLPKKTNVLLDQSGQNKNLKMSSNLHHSLTSAICSNSVFNNCTITFQIQEKK